MRRVVRWIVSCLLLAMNSLQAGNVRIIKQDEYDALIRPFFLHFNTDLPCEKYPETKNIDLLDINVPELQYSCRPACLTRLGLAFKPDYLLECIGSNMSASGEATELFFTHSNHLGSASWTTDKTVNPVQYIHYAPYGELFANQIATGYDERYKFTGKERDAESGYDNFGARNYIVDVGVWAKVDPLLNDYLDLSPYMYCKGNPIKYIDPDGRNPKDKLVGWTLGLLTIIIPLTNLTNIRDSYAPNNFAEYNNSLQGADNLSLAVGVTLSTLGDANMSKGLFISTMGAGLAFTGVGVTAGTGTATIGGAIVATGAIQVAFGNMLIANSFENKSQGYNRGVQRILLKTLQIADL